ncbi:MAG: D-alanine--D-alanine ligase [Clostridiales bacterium]|nr:D-alanine--D-alanine ligase [Clostridiales bacterium]
MKIVVLAGGLRPERNVSLSTGTVVCEALRGNGHQAALVDMYFGTEGLDGPPEALFRAPLSQSGRVVSPTAPDLEAVKAARKSKAPGMFGPGVLELCRMADLVFLALHGACGEDGRVQAAFDLLGIAYTGSGYLGSALAMDKDITKRVIAGLGVDTPTWEAVNYTAADVDRLTSRTAVPCVIKPVNSGSSIGVYIAHTKKELHKALVDSLAFGGRVVLERYVAGREIQVGILADQALPSIEIIPKAGFYDYENKYQPGAALEVCPADIPPEAETRVRSAALKVYHALGLSVYSRADFILDEAGTPWFLEINTLPGMTPTSLLPQEAASAGIGYAELCERILTASLEARAQGR